MIPDSLSDDFEFIAIREVPAFAVYIRYVATQAIVSIVGE